MPDQFRQIFGKDAPARLDRMNEQLLDLERSPTNGEALAALFREAHSLKGSAGMVGLVQVAALAHALEDVLARLRSGERSVTPGLVDVMLTTSDGLRALVTMEVAGGREAEATDIAAGFIERLVLSDRGPALPGTGPEPAAAPPRISASFSTIQVPVERLDEIDRLVGESAAAQLRIGRLLADKLGTDPMSVSEYRDLAHLLSRLQEVTLQARMVPLSTLGPSLHRTVRDVARAQGKSVVWDVVGGDTEIDRRVLEELTDPLVHMVRNAVDHGLESPAEREAAGKPAQGTVRMEGTRSGSDIVISITDDGNGIDLGRVREAAAKGIPDAGKLSETQLTGLIFDSGFSTAREVTDISGRGVGLDVVRASLAPLRGRVDVDSTPGRGTEFRISVPITLMVMSCLIVESGGQRFGLPSHAVASLLPANHPTQEVGGLQLALVKGRALPLSALGATLKIGAADLGPIVIVAAGSEHAFRVEALVGRRDVVLKSLGGWLPRLPAVAGASVEPDGSILVVLDPESLIRCGDQSRGATLQSSAPPPMHRQPSILVVDDALTVRELQRSILERAGYLVRVAADGREALTLLATEPSDLVLTDLDMPNLDGLALTAAVRRHPTLAGTPIVILTSHGSDADRQRGHDAGANAYIVKSGFDQARLLSLVERLLLGGEA